MIDLLRVATVLVSPCVRKHTRTSATQTSLRQREARPAAPRSSSLSENACSLQRRSDVGCVDQEETKTRQPKKPRRDGANDVPYKVWSQIKDIPGAKQQHATKKGVSVAPVLSGLYVYNGRSDESGGYGTIPNAPSLTLAVGFRNENPPSSLHQHQCLQSLHTLITMRSCRGNFPRTRRGRRHARARAVYRIYAVIA